MKQSGPKSNRPAALSGPERALLVLFLLSLPLVNPWVRGDGVGYYAFARSLLIQHNLDFTPDYQHANLSFREPRLDETGRPRKDYVTSTGHLDNHFSVGPALLWSPFLLVAHAGVLTVRALGSTVSADGFSAPYRLAMALSTALYGFLGLWVAFRIARKYTDERWAWLATIAVWGGTSLALYMYFNPSWSHAHSAFVVAVFFWYWLHTSERRSVSQWLILGAVAGLMLNVYFANAALLIIIGAEALSAYAAAFRTSPAWFSACRGLFLRHSLFAITLLICLLPAFLSRQVIYGSPFTSGYIPVRFWSWKSPAFAQVLFSSDHGIFSWTPLLSLSFIGLLLFWRRMPSVGGPALLGVLAFYYLIASYPDWDGISSFGNRFFVSLTVFFVLGLAVLLQQIAAYFRRPSTAMAVSSAALLLFLLWNFGLMFQWGSHLIPARGPVDWSEVTRNQVHAVPRRLSLELSQYLFHRRDLMKRIEETDTQQHQKQSLP